MKESAMKMLLARIDHELKEANKAREHVFNGASLDDIVASDIDNDFDINFIADKVDLANFLLNVYQELRKEDK